MINQIQTMQEKILQIKLGLYTHVYNNEKFISTLKCLLQSNLDLFNMDIDNNVIQLKIKKTNMKKSNQYIHSSQYYYGIISNIIISALMENKELVYSMVSNKVSMNDINEILFNPSTYQLFYNITALSDNIIYIYL